MRPPGTISAQLSRRTLLLAVLGVVVGTAVSLARTAGTGPFQTIFEEDGHFLLQFALFRPAWYDLFRPFVGYFQVLPRLMADVATVLPISWAAAVMSIEAAVVTALLTLAVYVASGAHFPHRLARLLVSAPMLFSATAENNVAEIYNRPATVQFFLAYALFWLLLWVPQRRAGRIVLICVLGLAAFSTFLVVLLIPLALLRLYVRRNGTSLTLLAFLAAGAALQIGGLYHGLSDRAFTVPRYQPLWALSSYVVWAVPHSLLGYRLEWRVTDVVHADLLWLIVVPWLIIAAVVTVALRRLTRPAWLFAIVAAAHSALLACATVMANGVITQRYLLPVAMLLLTALTAMLLPSQRFSPALARTPLVLLAALVFIISAFNYRWDNTYRAHSPRWSSQIERAAEACQVPGRREVQIKTGPEATYSLVIVPCHVITKVISCHEPYCVEIGPSDRLRPANRPNPATRQNRDAGPHPQNPQPGE